jgi:hypothetical protein
LERRDERRIDLWRRVIIVGRRLRDGATREQQESSSEKKYEKGFSAYRHGQHPS